MVGRAGCDSRMMQIGSLRMRSRARRSLWRQPPRVREEVMNAIERLPSGDIIPLTGTEFYRLKAGRYRVILREDGMISEITHRGSAYGAFKSPSQSRHRHKQYGRTARHKMNRWTRQVVAERRRST